MKQELSTQKPVDLDFDDTTARVQEAIHRSINARDISRALRLERALKEIDERCAIRPPKDKAAADDLLDEILEAVMIASDAPLGNLQLLDAVTGALVIRVQRGFDDPFIKFFRAVEKHEAACGSAFAKGTPEVVEDVATSPLYSEAARTAMLAAGALAVQSVALSIRGRKFGVISVHYTTKGISALRQESFAAAAPLVSRVVATTLGLSGR